VKAFWSAASIATLVFFLERESTKAAILAALVRLGAARTSKVEILARVVWDSENRR
jgi:hypothetical protein